LTAVGCNAGTIKAPHRVHPEKWGQIPAEDPDGPQRQSSVKLSNDTVCTGFADDSLKVGLFASSGHIGKPDMSAVRQMV
jgi:hypothetical protein